MKRNPYFNDFEAFNSLDLDGSGGVTAQEIHAMLQSRGFFASHKEVHDLVDKFDKTRTGQISFGQFRDEMEPKSPVRHWKANKIDMTLKNYWATICRSKVFLITHRV